MAQNAALTDTESAIVQQMRSLPPRLQEHVLDYVQMLREQGHMTRPCPEKSARLGLPGPPMWRMSPEEAAEMDAFLEASDSPPTSTSPSSRACR